MQSRKFLLSLLSVSLCCLSSNIFAGKVIDAMLKKQVKPAKFDSLVAENLSNQKELEKAFRNAGI